MRSIPKKIVIYIVAHGVNEFGTYNKLTDEYLQTINYSTESPFRSTNYNTPDMATQVYKDIRQRSFDSPSFTKTRKQLRGPTTRKFTQLKQDANDLKLGPQTPKTIKFLKQMQLLNELEEENKLIGITGDRNFWPSHQIRARVGPEGLNTDTCMKRLTFTDELYPKPRNVYVANTYGLPGLQVDGKYEDNIFIDIVEKIKEREFPPDRTDPAKLTKITKLITYYQEAFANDNLRLVDIINLSYELGLEIDIFDSSCNGIEEDEDISKLDRLPSQEIGGKSKRKSKRKTKKTNKKNQRRKSKRKSKRKQ